jgi:hypothetical protein
MGNFDLAVAAVLWLGCRQSMNWRVCGHKDVVSILYDKIISWIRTRSSLHTVACSSIAGMGRRL